MKECKPTDIESYKKRGGRVFDAVYGYIELDEAEFALVTSPIFQRLHWIKQLGPLHTVFPSAQHSRFSHTLGVFYIIKKMIEHLKKRWNNDRSGYEFRGTEEQELKFAALLHDIGHVPLSHVGEEVLKDMAEESIRARQKSVTYKGQINVFKYQEPSWWVLFPEKEYHGGHTKPHERWSAEMVLHNEEIDKVLSQNPKWTDIKQREEAKKRIAQIIVGQNETDVPTLLLHSELDADRLDYLLRDSFFTGVGYGKIELDYIISRLCIHRDKENFPTLCVEEKGLHTIEHYILGRFFLQTQVIFNRKVRLMDLLFADVMKYMVKEGEKNECGIMNLQEFRDHIQNSRGETKREHLHAIYGYTDAEVFNKMRRLHEALDPKEKNSDATNEEGYINDCIKIIMDGRIDEPLIAEQKLVDLEKYPNYKKDMEEEKNKIRKKITKENNIYPERIKVNVVEQEVMKYQKRKEAGDDSGEFNKEAVKIRDKTEGEQHEWMFAAESNATILRDLHDKALLILNVYYIPPKSRPDANKDDKIKKAIRQTFRGFVAKHFKGVLGCGCLKGRHMCQIVLEDNGFENARKLSQNANYVCKRCVRVSEGMEYLCKPVTIKG